jgi:hypothetical protein
MRLAFSVDLSPFDMLYFIFIGRVFPRMSFTAFAAPPEPALGISTALSNYKKLRKGLKI